MNDPEGIRARWERDPLGTVAELRAELELGPDDRLVVEIERAAWWRSPEDTERVALDERLSFDYVAEEQRPRQRVNDVGARWMDDASTPAPLYPVPFHMDLLSVCGACGRWECRAGRRIPRVRRLLQRRETVWARVQQMVSVGGAGMRNMVFLRERGPQ